MDSFCQHSIHTSNRDRYRRVTSSIQQLGQHDADDLISIIADRMPPEISPNVQTTFFMTSAPREKGFAAPNLAADPRAFRHPKE